VNIVYDKRQENKEIKKKVYLPKYKHTYNKDYLLTYLLTVSIKQFPYVSGSCQKRQNISKLATHCSMQKNKFYSNTLVQSMDNSEKHKTLFSNYMVV